MPFYSHDLDARVETSPSLSRIDKLPLKIEKMMTVMSIETIHIDELMNSSGVGFGTSGARGRVEAMSDKVCFTYTLAFLQHLVQVKGLAHGSHIAIAGDFRPSTPRIMGAVAAAITDSGYVAVNCGHIASPAVADYGIRHQYPSIMVTGMVMRFSLVSNPMAKTRLVTAYVRGVSGIRPERIPR